MKHRIQEQTIQNAGMVLLHPFLHTLFSRLSYLSDNQFSDKAKQIRAALLLQHMVDGVSINIAPDLFLNKLLCGLNIDEVLPATIVLTENEKLITEECLQILPQQWEKLKNTSIEALRESFLKRTGIVSKTEDGYKTKVEQRSYDILLQSLPWSIGMIKYQWMKQVLLVEWI